MKIVDDVLTGLTKFPKASVTARFGQCQIRLRSPFPLQSLIYFVRRDSLQRYREESCKIVQLLQDFSPDVVVEKASIDESYLDLTNLVRRKMNSNTDRSSESATGFVEGLPEDTTFVSKTSSDVLLTLASGIVAGLLLQFL